MNRPLLFTLFVLLAACSDRSPAPATGLLAQSGRLSVATAIETIACSVAVSCSMRRPPHAKPSAVVRTNLVCRGKAGERVTLLRGPLTLLCDGQTSSTEPRPEPGHLWQRMTSPRPDTLTQVTTYLGADPTPCEGGQCESRYWNLSLELAPKTFDAEKCILMTSMTALTDDKRHGSHPVIDIELDLIENQRLVCSQHTLGKPGSGVTLRQTEDLSQFTQRFPSSP